MANGSCSNSSQSMTITWGPGHSLQINFGLNETAKDFYVSGLSLNVNASVFKNVQGKWTTIYSKVNVFISINIILKGGGE